MKDLSVKKIILCALALMAAVFLIAGPAFDLVQITIYHTSSGLTGYDFLRHVGEEGMDALGKATIAFTLIMMIYGVIMVIFAVIACFAMNSKQAKGIGATTVIGGVAFSVAYLVCGVLVANKEKEYMEDWAKTSTVAFVPLILIALVCIAYWVIRFAMREKPLKSSAPAQTPVTQEIETIDLLIRYRSLLEDGVITQEEFDEKKQSLLK